MSVYVLVAIIRKRLGLEVSLYQILQILSITLFEKVPIVQALQAPDSQSDLPDSGNQLILAISTDIEPATLDVGLTRFDLHQNNVAVRLTLRASANLLL